MAIRRITINYTVYSPNYSPGDGECLDFRTFKRAVGGAKRLGAGASIHRNFNQADKDQPIADWWQSELLWVWDGKRVQRAYDRSGSSRWQVPAPRPPFLELVRRG